MIDLHHGIYDFVHIMTIFGYFFFLPAQMLCKILQSTDFLNIISSLIGIIGGNQHTGIFPQQGGHSTYILRHNRQADILSFTNAVWTIVNITRVHVDI